MEIKFKGGKMERKMLGLVAFAMVALLGIGAVSAFGGFGNEVSADYKVAMKNAVESGDYVSWKSLVESQLTEERFNEMHSRYQERADFRESMQEARDSGDLEQVAALREELGRGKGIHKQNMRSGECPLAK